MRLMEGGIAPKVRTPGITLRRQSEQAKQARSKVMNTLHGTRKVALIGMLAAGALIGSATQGLADAAPGIGNALADLGHITVLAPREAPLADLGSLTVTAPRQVRLGFADLGAITVTASRIADARVTDLGGLTVTAKRYPTVAVASAESATHFWK
jgi:hypothetical protein